MNRALGLAGALNHPPLPPGAHALHSERDPPPPPLTSIMACPYLLARSAPMPSTLNSCLAVPGRMRASARRVLGPIMLWDTGQRTGRGERYEGMCSRRDTYDRDAVNLVRRKVPDL